MLKKSTLLSVSIFVLLFIGLSDYGYGCHKDDQPHGKFTECDPPDPRPPGGGDDGGTDKYSAKVHFDDHFENDKCYSDDKLEHRYHFCSDGLGPYIDGFGNVTAVGDKFRLSLTLQTPARRSFFLDFSDNRVGCSGCGGDVPELEDGATVNEGFTSGFGNGNVFSLGEVPRSLLDMPPPDDEGKLSPENRALFISFRDTRNYLWGLSFSPDVCESDLVEVTRTSATTWDFVSEVVPDEDKTGIACLERAKNFNKGPPILQGRYIVPFRFTVTLL